MGFGTVDDSKSALVKVLPATSGIFIVSKKPGRQEGAPLRAQRKKACQGGEIRRRKSRHSTSASLNNSLSLRQAWPRSGSAVPGSVCHTVDHRSPTHSPSCPRQREEDCRF